MSRSRVCASIKRSIFYTISTVITVEAPWMRVGARVTTFDCLLVSASHVLIVCVSASGGNA